MVHNERELAMAFLAGRASIIVGVAETPPRWYEDSRGIRRERDGQWLEAYYMGREHGAKEIRELQRCPGCAGCEDENEELSSLMQDGPGALTREVLAVMGRRMRAYHKPQYVFHVARGTRLAVTPRGSQADASGRAVRWLVVNGEKRRANTYPERQRIRREGRVKPETQREYELRRKQEREERRRQD